MTIAVIYIARGHGAGLTAGNVFFCGYRSNPPGCAHRLVVVTKGWTGVPGLTDMNQLAVSSGADIVCLPDDGFDWGAYMRIARSLSDTWICLLNSHSYPIVSGWLEKLKTCANQQRVGACGATGSWGTWYFRYPYFDPSLSALVQYPIRVAKTAIGHFHRRGEIIPFPNPHLRSNALFINRQLFLDFCAEHIIPKSKSDAHILESGKCGLSSYLISIGLNIQVVGANGVAYEPSDWITSQTFRVPDQPNLLISDNQTSAYLMANWEQKRRLEYASWGKVFTQKSHN